MNQHCPNCGYSLHRDNHPMLGVVRFCRAVCVTAWSRKHGISHVPADVTLAGVDRRRSAIVVA